MRKLFSVVIPIYGNEDNIPVTIPYIMDRLDLFSNYDVEIIMVNDGSPDQSWELMKKYKRIYPNVIRIYKLTRNFGQSAAWRCGMDMAKGDVIGFISADLQDPFELFKDMLDEWEKAYPVVVGERKERLDGGFSAIFSKIFQRFVHNIIDPRYPKGGFDFFIIDKKVKNSYSRLHSSFALTQLWILWLGYDVKTLPYTRRERKVGKSGYNFAKKVDMGIYIMTTYSKFLINCIEMAGICLLLVSIILGMVLIVKAFMGYTIQTEWIIVCLFILIAAVIMGSLGIIGYFLWNILHDTRNSPVYLIDDSEINEEGDFNDE